MSPAPWHVRAASLVRGRLPLPVFAPLLLPFAASVLSAQAVPMRGEGPGVPALVVLTREAGPTERKIVESLRRLVPPGSLQVLGAEPEERAAAALARLDRESEAVIIALGRARAELALRQVSRRRLVLGGDLGGAEAAVAAQARARTTATLVQPLRVPLDELVRAREALFPDRRRAGAIIAGGVAEDLSGLAPAMLSVAFDGRRSPEEVVRGLAPQIDLLFLPDAEPLLPVAERLLAEAVRLGVPVLTTSPWLARSGAAAGVVPDLDLYACRVALLALGAATEPVAVPSLRIVDLDVFRRLKLPVGALVPARADEVLDAGRRSSP